MKPLYCPALLLLTVLAGCSPEKKVSAAVPEKAEAAAGAIVSTPNSVTLPPGAPQLAKLKIEAVRLEEVATDEVAAPASLEANPNRVAHATLPVAGRVTSVAVKLGDAVREGQPLLQLESQEVDAAELAVRQADTAIVQAKTIEQKAQTDVDRLADLYAHQAVAQKEVLAAQNALALAKSSVDVAASAKQQTLRRLEILGLKAGAFGQRLTIPAPLSGKVLSMSVVAGEYRNDLSVPLMTIADLRTLWVSSNVPESYIRHCRIGGAVEIELVAFPGEVFRGYVSHIADTVDSETRSIKVRAELDNSSGRFRPEMYGQIRYGQLKERLPIVPESAILQDSGQPSLWVETKAGQFERRQVTLAKHFDGRVAIREGLRAGDRVVTSGAIYLKGGI